MSETQARFSSSSHRLRVALLTTAEVLRDRVAEVVRPHGLTMQQFNALRILRGRRRQELEAAERDESLGSFSTSDLRDRLLQKASDTPRLVDRLVARGWATKVPCSHDARRVHLAITDAGLAVLEDVSDDALDATTAPLSDLEADRLAGLLEKLHG